ncbi:MAG: VWA domain-containing protein [Clostridia bacterium]|nr:VWA domain-containing protein [Clostridia bacterium]MBQ8766776.1 VWA domain-containing protein [Clostridia bacterium]
MKKKRMLKKGMSLLLTFAILIGIVAIGLPFMKIDVGAAGTITTSDGTNETITQERVVTDYATDYANYKNYYLNGAGEATDIVIPGLNATQDYVVQGMTYYPEKDWMIVTAYHNDGTASSKAFCLDAATGDFVAMLSFLNVDGTVNMDHGGGIAFSENNIYYSCGDTDRSIAYAPISALDGIAEGEHRVVQLVDEIEFYEVGSVTSDSKTAYTAYVCYDQGYLWMGNFYDLGAKLAGVTIAADDYNAPANSQYNSMVFGYKLQGSTSEEEWNNLKSGATDSRSNPTHTIALNNNIKDVQYAVVDSGKLYLSCSYGSGAGNSVSFGFGETSKLIVSDIDLSAIPTKELTISTSSDNSTTKTVKGYVIEEYETYEMMPMSEGLCVINDLIFCTFEGASNKYMNESSGVTSIGNCEKPVDVIWKIDPYALQNMVKTEDNNALHYEPVTSLSEIVDGEDYIIVYESSEKDPVTQMPILYAIDSHGGYQHYNLSKRDQNNAAGYAGAIGHAITEYSVEGGKLYLTNAEKDDVRNIRWELTSLGSGAYSIKNNEYTYSNYPNFYCDATSIAMATDNARGTSMVLAENGKGGFYISGGGYYLWCNDGTTESYNTAYNKYYTDSTVAMYSGVTEQPGTFHTDGLNGTGSNVLGGQVTTFDHGVFYIYKRVVDKTATTYESRVYTDMQAELQSNGTYTIDLETYAISPNQYQYVGERPTDFIIVMDTSESVNDGSDGTGIQENSGDITLSQMASTSITSDDNGTGVYGYAFTNEALYYKHSDGNYYRIHVAINTQAKTGGFLGIGGTYHQKIWTYYVADDGLYYVLPGVTNAGISAIQTWTRTEFITNVDAGTNYSAEAQSTTNGNRQNCKIYNGTYYKFITANENGYQTPMYTIKEKAADIVDQIAAEGSDNRIAVTTYGGSASYLNTSSSWATSGFTDALWSASNASTIKTQIANVASSGQQSDNTGMELQFAQNIVANSGSTYDADGDRNLAIIFMSDGVPGAYDGANITTAANNVIAKANTLKNTNGAFIYSIIVGADNDSWDKNTYMEAVSSKYPAATTLTSLGGGNIDGVEYVINMANTSMDNFLNFSSIAGREITKNEAVGLSNLSASSILFEELNEAFKPIADANGNLLDGITITTTLVEGNFDAVERFTFKGEEIVASTANVTTSVSDTRAISVTGYNYATEYVSQSKTGRKLKIKIEGVLADEDANITNTSINNTATTAIYKDTALTDAFKYFPTEYFNIPEYTYVLDYDMPMYDSDINGTLLSVDGGLNKQSTYKTTRETSNVALKFANSNLDMTYELVSGAYTEADNRSYCLIQRDDGTYDWFRINIVPASNVLFEEQRFTASTAGSLAKSNWTLDGTALETYQTLSGDNDRYGYDDVYASNGAGYSNGTVYKTTVNSTTKRSETMTFSYTGTGFDLMAACGKTTGIQMVNIKNAAGEIEKVFMVDTYYVDTENYDGALLKQVPIINYTNAGGYGTYTVEVTAAYLSTANALSGTRSSLAGMFNSDGYTVESLLKAMKIDVPADEIEYIWFNDNSILNGGTGPVAHTVSGTRATTTTDVELDCYIDGIRVYNPLGEDSSLYIDSEKGATYYNIVGELASGEGNTITSDSGLFAYVVGELAADENGNAQTLTFANYQSVGPQHELYLQKATDTDGSHAVAFNVTVPNADSRVMISLRAVDGATTTKVASGENAITFDINTATEQYFDITPYLDIDTTTGKANVIITNTGDGLLSVNNLKLVDATAQVVASEDLTLMAMSLSVEPTTVEPNSYDYNAVVDNNTQEPEVDVPDADEPSDDNGNNNNGGSVIEVPDVMDSIFAKISAFFKKLFASFANLF